MNNIGDFTSGKTIRCLFNTHQSDGTPITLAGTPAVSVYKDGSTTQSTTGVTLTVDFDTVTGLHLVAVDTSADGTFYAAGSDFRLVLTAGTVNSVSVVGTVVGEFSLSNRSALRPTTADRTLDVDTNHKAPATLADTDTTGLPLSSDYTAARATKLDNLDAAVSSRSTYAGGAVASVTANVTVGGYAAGQVPLQPTIAGRTLDVTANGNAGIDWGNIDNNTTVVNLSGTTVLALTNAVTVGAINANAVNASALATDAVTEIVTGILGTAVPGAFAAGTLGYLVGTNLDSQLSAIRASQIVATGTAQAGGQGAITLAASASATPYDYRGTVIRITAGTGVGQLRLITAYDGSTKVATVATQWGVTPAADSQYEILTHGPVDVMAVDSGTILGTFLSGGTEAGTGKIILATSQPSVTIPTVTAITNPVTLTSSERVAVADAHIGRNIKGGSSTGRTVGQVYAAQRNKVAFDVPAVGQFTVYDVDDTTSLWTGVHRFGRGEPRDEP